MHSLLHSYFEEKAPIDREVFERIAPLFRSRKTKRNEILLSEGEICKFNLFVNKGCVRLYTVSNDGTELTRYFAFEGKFGTALSSLIEEKPSFEYIQSIEKSEILVISKTDFFRLVETIPQVNLIYRDMLEMAYITSQKRIYGLQGQSALERLKWLIAHQPGILTRLSSKMIASYLGVTPYTLSRLKAQL